ncbi:MAG: hypothetical protein ACI898_001447, partial [Flavobacteriales bacterium]
MIHPHTALRFISPEIGIGVVATKFIPAGTITWVLDKLDQRFTQDEFENIEPHYQSILEFYTFRNGDGKLILCWDNGRFVNHSFNSNCLSTAYDFEIAIRDIQPGEQLTDDYGYLNISAPFKGIDEGTERKTVYPDDLLEYHKKWDEQIAAVFHAVNDVNQPLHELISEPIKKKIDQVIKGEIQLESILKNYFEQKKVAHSLS